jgi:hypothetical protein
MFELLFVAKLVACVEMGGVKDKGQVTFVK